MDTRAIKLAWNHCSNEKEQVTVYGLCDEVDQLRQQLADKERELHQCQADKENLRQKNAILRQRPDLPVDRIPACDELDELRQELEAKQSNRKEEVMSDGHY